MKNRAIVTLCFALVLFLGSQALTAQVEIGAFWLPQTYRLLNDSDINYYTYQMVPFEESTFGGYIAFVSKKKVGLELGFIHSFQGQKYDDTGDNFLYRSISGVTEVKLSYYKFPFLFKYRSNPYQQNRTGKSSRLGFNFLLGPQLSLLAEADWLNNEEQVTVFNTTGQPTDLKNLYQKQNIDVVLAFGVNLALSDVFTVNLILRSDYTLNEIENKNYTLANGDLFFNELRAASSQVTVGLVLGVSVWLLKRN